MDSMHSNSFAIVFMIVLVVVPALAYLAARIYGAHEAASDHPVVHHRR
jgi:hypothetical protein